MAFRAWPSIFDYMSTILARATASSDIGRRALSSCHLLKTLDIDNVVAYADDITLTTNGLSLDLALQTMQSLLNTVYEWSNMHCLSINTGKCFYIIISPFIKNLFRVTWN